MNRPRSNTACRAAAWLLAVGLLGCGPQPATEPHTVAVGEALGGGQTAGYARALGPREFRFPADHGAHPEYRNEWWYVTANLEDEQGRRYGLQFTLFRIALAPQAPRRASRWATRQVWMGHFAVTDAAGGLHRAHERYARGALGLAGAQLSPRFRVWLQDWALEGGPGAAFPWRLRAAVPGVEAALELTPIKDIVLQGEDGLSPKSDEPGNASYYYSLPRMAAGGELRLDGRRHRVRGLAWLDREWSTSALGPEQAGWDWFSLQLADGRDLMYYRLRRKDGSADPHSAGTLVEADGRVRRLRADSVSIETLAHWMSPTGVRYPSLWRLRVEGLARPLTVRPVIPDQEMDLTVRYWEGAVDVLDPDGRPLGRGYVELAGYGAEGG